MQRVRVLGIVLFVLGLWVFLAPFIGPVMHLYYTPPPTGMMNMARMAGMSARVVVVNQAMVFFNFIPGVALILIGIYHLFSGRTSPVTH